MVIPAAVRSAIAEHARAELPNEACGLLLLEGDAAVEYVPAENASPSPYFFELRLDPVVWADIGERDVDSVMATAEAAGAQILKPATKTFWGGYNGYFADPDGHVWEIAHNPHWGLDTEGKVELPE